MRDEKKYVKITYFKIIRAFHKNASLYLGSEGGGGYGFFVKKKNLFCFLKIKDFLLIFFFCF